MNLTDKLLDDIRDRIDEAIVSAFEDPYDAPTHVIADYWFDDESGLEIKVTEHNDITVYLYHKNSDNDRDCPNIRSLLEEGIPSWNDLCSDLSEEEYDEWNEHGFRDEADYWRYRLG